jgi:hypothetical protein
MCWGLSISVSQSLFSTFPLSFLVSIFLTFSFFDFTYVYLLSLSLYRHLFLFVSCFSVSFLSLSLSQYFRIFPIPSVNDSQSLAFIISFFILKLFLPLNNCWMALSHSTTMCCLGTTNFLSFCRLVF